MPVAGSLDEKHGNEGIAIIFETTRKNLILCGVSVFLPHATDNQQKYSKILIDVALCEHGVSQYGRVGEKIDKNIWNLKSKMINTLKAMK